MNSLDWIGGMDYWSGVLDWTTGVEYWTGLLEWSTGLDYWSGRGDILKHAHNNKKFLIATS